MRYRRAFLQGGSFFFTVVTEQRRPLVASADAVEGLRMAFRRVRSTRPFEVDANVVLAGHLHCIWTLPSPSHRGEAASAAPRCRSNESWAARSAGGQEARRLEQQRDAAVRCSAWVRCFHFRVLIWDSDVVRRSNHR